MSNPVITDLFIYPIKSTAPLKVSRSWVDLNGFAGDRRYMLVDAQGRFITARRYPHLTQLFVVPTDRGLALSCADRPSLVLNVEDYPETFLEVEIWGQQLLAQSCGVRADRWLSSFLGCECRLVYFAHSSERQVKDSHHDPIRFVDGYPLLLMSTSSLQWLNERAPVAIDAQQFRANMVISGDLPFAEDGWLDIRIGEVELQLHSPCERCKLITLAPGDSAFNAQQEPLRTLLHHRRLKNGGAIFGQNLLVRKPGVIAEGMSVEVLSRKPHPVLN